MEMALRSDSQPGCLRGMVERTASQVGLSKGGVSEWRAAGTGKFPGTVAVPQFDLINVNIA